VPRELADRVSGVCCERISETRGYVLDYIGVIVESEQPGTAACQCLEEALLAGGFGRYTRWGVVGM
jgi:hypothetical protein